MRRIYGYMTLVMAATAMLSLGGCIVNDIPYPNRQPSFKAFEVEGQIGVSEFDNVKRTVSLTVDGEHDIKDVKVIYYEISDSTEMVPEMPERIDLSQPYRCTLRTWQDYEWTIDAKWDVDYVINVENQVGAAAIDTVNRVAIVMVAKSQPLSSVRIDKMVLGPANAVITPDPYERRYDLLGDGTLFEVSMFGRTEKWRLSAQHADFTVNGRSLVAWTKTATATADVPVGSSLEMGYEYRREVDEVWTKTDIGNVSSEGGVMTAVMTDLEPGTTYVCRPFLGSEVGREQTFTTDAVVEIPNMSFEEWFNVIKLNHNCWFPYAEGGTPYWATGNDGIATLTDGATYPVTDKVKEGKYAAYMETKKVAIVGLAAGNLFTGDFITNVQDPGSSPRFGRPFTGRPAKLSGWYIYQPGIIDVHHSTKYPEDSQYIGQTDKCHIYIYLENWRGATARPKEADRDIVAYGEFKTDASTTDYQQFVINLEYRTTTIKPTHIVIVATSSVYGERYCGATGSKLWLDALSFDYDVTPIVKGA
ncbi:MAG: PCMD domain-containing protein [Rikenellaceae bacterium]|nr:PCMD domain-containing protein [Rikenellaceae bacterium]